MGESAVPESATQSTLGTPGYSAPEQKTDPQRVDSRADIYSLGVVFYELLTGELPGKPLQPPSRKVHIDVRLDEVVLRALEQKPELRYQQVSEVKTCVDTIASTIASANVCADTVKMQVKASAGTPDTGSSRRQEAQTKSVGDGASPGRSATAAATGRKSWISFCLETTFAGTLLVGSLCELLLRHVSGGSLIGTFILLACVSAMLAFVLESSATAETQRVCFKAGAWLALIAALPVVGFGVFFLNALLSERGGWHPNPAETVIVPLVWLGTVLLPVCGWRLLRAAGQPLGGAWKLAVVIVAVVIMAFTISYFQREQKRRQAEQQREMKAAQEIALALPQLRSEDVERRRSAAMRFFSLGTGAKGAVPELLQALKDSDGLVRMFAASALGRIGTNAGPAAASELSRALEDPDQRVRFSAAEALGSVDLHTTANLTVLVDRLTNRPSENAASWQEQRREAVAALAKMGARALPALPALHAIENEPGVNSHVSVKGAIAQIEKWAKRFDGRLLVPPGNAHFRPVVERALSDRGPIKTENGLNFAHAEPALGEFRLTLTNGVSVEVVAVTRNPLENKLWWRPEGTPLPQPPGGRLVFHPTGMTTEKELGEDAYALLVHYDSPPGAAPGGRWQHNQECTPRAEHLGTLEIEQDDQITPVTEQLKRLGRKIAGAAGGPKASGKFVGYAAVVRFPAGTEETTLQCATAVGPWEPLAIFDGRRTSVLVEGTRVLCTHLRQEAKGKCLDVTHDVNRDQYALRMIAMFKDGKREEVALHSGLLSARETQGYVLLEPGRRVENIQEFVLERTPWVRGEIRNIALRPKPAKAQAVTAFGPMIERVVSGEGDANQRFIDFDTSKLFAAAESFGSKDEPSPEETQKWWRKTGIDAVGDTSAAVRGLIGFDMVATPVPSEEWERATPARLDYYFTLANLGTPVTMSGRGELPATIAFKTREGAQGLLQITGFTDSPKAVRIRYKLVGAKAQKPVAEAGRSAMLKVAKDGSGTYTSIQAALDAAAEGAIIRIAPGRYEESLVITKPVSLLGEGWDKTVIGPTKPLSGPPPEAREEIERRSREARTDAERERLREEMQERYFRPVVRIRGAKGVWCAGIKFTQPGTAPEGKLLEATMVEVRAAEARFSDCALLSSPGNGIVIGDGATVSVSNSLIAAVWSTGIHVERGTNCHLTVTDSDVRNCHYAGIVIGRGQSDVTVQRCRISGAAWHGIRYDDASPTIADNLIFANARSGIYASGKTAAQVRGNVFWNNEMNGVSCWFENRDRIASNTFAANLREGLSVLGAAEPVVERNIFWQNPQGILRGDIRNNSASAKAAGKLQLRENVFWTNDVHIASTAGQPPGKATAPASLPLADFPGNQEIAPGFRDSAGGDFSLPAESDAAKAGVGAPTTLRPNSPWPLQPEEKAIIPDGNTRDSRQWKRPTGG